MKYVVEFLGTAFSVGALALTGNPMLFVAALAAAIAIGGKISGGHYNPVISLWSWLSSKLSTADFSMYVLSQLSAGVFIWVIITLTGQQS